MRERSLIAKVLAVAAVLAALVTAMIAVAAPSAEAKRPKPAMVEGVVTAVVSTTITVTTESGSTRIVRTTSATSFRSQHQPARLGDVAIGRCIKAKGTITADESLSASILKLQRGCGGK